MKQALTGTGMQWAVMYKNSAFSSHAPVIVDYEIEEL